MSDDVTAYTRVSVKGVWRVTGYWQVLSRVTRPLILGYTRSVWVVGVFSGRLGLVGLFI